MRLLPSGSRVTKGNTSGCLFTRLRLKSEDRNADKGFVWSN